MGLFGTDGIRGVANTELTPELTFSVGAALVRTLQEEGERRPEIVVGRDPRASGEMLEAAMTAGVTSAGGNVVHLGVVTTPAVAYLVTDLAAASGVMISASHNPVADNGLKCFGPDGYKLTDAEEQRIEELVGAPADPGRRPTGAAVGRVSARTGAVESYLAHLAGTIDVDLGVLHVVVDCANGAASAIAPVVFERAGCRVTTIHATPDGTNINAGCGSTHPEVVGAAVTEHGADLGLAHDGDADRLIAADHTGTPVDGDAILAILARELHEAGRLDTVVTTVMTNLGFKQAMQRLGIGVVETAVGDRYVLDAMRTGGHPVGGEQSGHIIFSEHATTGDGILTALQLLATVVRRGEPLAALASIMSRLPQVLINVEGVDRGRLDSDQEIWAAVAQAETELGASGRVLVRPSGTEPVVRVMVEADSEERAVGIADRLSVLVAERLSLRASTG